MVPFFVQIKCQMGKSYQVANSLADAEIASEIYSTAGDFDLLVKFYVDQATDIGHFIAEKVQTIRWRAGHAYDHHLQGVRRTLNILLRQLECKPRLFVISLPAASGPAAAAAKRCKRR